MAPVVWCVGRNPNVLEEQGMRAILRKRTVENPWRRLRSHRRATAWCGPAGNVAGIPGPGRRLGTVVRPGGEGDWRKDAPPNESSRKGSSSWATGLLPTHPRDHPFMFVSFFAAPQAQEARLRQHWGLQAPLLRRAWECHRILGPPGFRRLRKRAPDRRTKGLRAVCSSSSPPPPPPVAAPSFRRRLLAWW